MLVLAVGAAIANLDVRYGGDGLVVRTGWNHAADATSPGSPPQPRLTPVDWKAQAEALDRRLRDLEQTIATATSLAGAERVGLGLERRTGAAACARCVGQSETRQQRVVATRLAELMRDFDAQAEAGPRRHRSGHDPPSEHEQCDQGYGAAARGESRVVQLEVDAGEVRP